MDVPPSDPFDPVHAADPEPRLAAARACPARKVAPHVALVASEADVDAVLRDNDRFSTRGNFALSRDRYPSTTRGRRRS